MTLLPGPVASGAPTVSNSPTCWMTLDSPLGPLLAVASSAGLSGLYLSGQRFLPEIQPGWEADDEPFGELAAQLGAYFRGHRGPFRLHLAATGTPFQLAVWRQLCAIPHGSTISYRTLAERIGNPKAVRAVGLAVGRNPLAIVVPCHRVIGSDGALTGYGGGLSRKRWLLGHESSQQALPA